jgi:hypothetical protein
MNHEELWVMATWLRTECKEKLEGWRKQTVKKLLKGVPSEDRESDVQKIKEALRIRDTHFENRWLKISLLKTRLAWITSIIVILLFTFLGMTLLQHPPPWLKDLGPAMIQLAIAFGILGGAVSASMSLASSRAESKIPEQVRSFSVTLARPAIGAAGAVAAFVLVKAGFADVIEIDSPWAVASVSFLAGFSERWFLGLVKVR